MRHFNVKNADKICSTVITKHLFILSFTWTQEYHIYPFEEEQITSSVIEYFYFMIKSCWWSVCCYDMGDDVFQLWTSDTGGDEQQEGEGEN